MKACPVCAATGEDVIPILRVFGNKDHDIGICEKCGAVFKVKPAASRSHDLSNVYTSNSWSVSEEYHQKRLNFVAKKSCEFASFGPGDPVLDIGAGVGLLHDALAAVNPVGNYFALEPSATCVEVLRSRFPDAELITDSLDTATLPEKHFKAVFVCGVDYLFDDVGQAFRKISSALRDDGLLFVNRNVFIDMMDTPSNSSNSAESLFAGNNPLLSNWFHSRHYVEFLSGMFDRVDLSILRLEEEKDGVKGRVRPSMTFVGRKAGGNVTLPIRNAKFASKNRKLIREMLATGKKSMLVETLSAL